MFFDFAWSHFDTNDRLADVCGIANARKRLSANGNDAEYPTIMRKLFGADQRRWQLRLAAAISRRKRRPPCLPTPGGT